MTWRMLATSAALGCLCLVMGADGNRPDESAPRKPFFNAREHQTEYAGSGRETPEVTNVSEVRLGYFGPDDPDHPQGGDMWRAAQLAVEEANARGGYRGKPFRLVAGWSENPWGTGVAQVVRMVYQDKVWGIIGGIDGPSTHLAEQVVAKARLPLIGPGSTDKSVNLANVPWMFSCLPGDHLLAPVLVAEISARVKKQPFVLVSSGDHDAHLFTVELMKCFAKRKMGPSYRFEYKQNSRDVTELVSQVVQSNPHAVVVAAGAGDGARLVAGLRDRGFKGPVFGGPAMGRQSFSRECGAAAEGVIFPLLYHPQQEKVPDYAAAATYDAVRLLIAAVHKAGLNRARIRDALEQLSPWTGAMGTIKWDKLGSNTQTVHLGTIRHGRMVPLVK